MADELTNLLRTNIAEVIDPEIVSPILSSPPFIQVDGLFNLRDVGKSPNSNLRHDYVFRSGSLENITPQGKDGLRKLGIKTIFDLRSARESTEFPDPEIDGIEEVAAQTETDPLAATKYTNLVDMYMDLLDTHKNVWREVLSHVRHHPDKPFLVHCTGGKDRTGIAVALILSVTGLPPSWISHEYALTRLGIEPAREMLLKKLTGGKPPPADWMEDERMKVFMRIDPDVMEEFLAAVQEKFGGVEMYVVRELGFGEEDLKAMRQNLRSV